MSEDNGDWVIVTSPRISSLWTVVKNSWYYGKQAHKIYFDIQVLLWLWKIYHVVKVII